MPGLGGSRPQPRIPSTIAMYAIIAADGRQYKVHTGDEIQIDLRDDAQQGDQITFDRVLLVSGEAGVKVGKPLVDGRQRRRRGARPGNGRQDLHPEDASPQELPPPHRPPPDVHPRPHRRHQRLRQHQG